MRVAPSALAPALLTLAGCSAAPVAPPAPVESPPADPAATEGSGALALLPLLDAEAGSTGNLVYSPASIDQAFGMLQLGAAGATQAQLGEVLPPPRDPRGLAHKSEGVEVRLANALWLSDRFRFRPTFVTAAGERYGAAAATLDFARPGEVAGTINAWADKATEGLIREVITPDAVTPERVAFLTNALFFDGEWANRLDPKGERPFLFGDGQERPFFMMGEVVRVPLVRREGLAAVRLPYRGERYAMDLIMPEQRSVLAAAPAPAALAEIGAALGSESAGLVDLTLPRFEIAYEKDLIPGLRALGLTLPFDKAGADLSAMAEPGQARLVVDAVRHLARLQVFETGTRAAAVTSIAIKATSARILPEPTVPFVVDRPFVMVIRDLERGQILFVARIAAPQPFTPEVRF